jgi:tRNA dimethylallyltransferase
METISQKLKTRPFPILVLLGVTASGKTELSLELAHKLGAEIISSDSVQVYKELDIGSAKPTSKQLGEIPHYLIDILSPQEFYSAGKFVQLAAGALDQIYSKNKIPILIGGNMLYVRCLIKGMATIPPVSAFAKKAVARFYQKGLEFCYQELIQRDPLAKEHIVPQDTQRILRALEVVLSHKKSIYDFHRENNQQVKKYSPVYLGIQADKTEIHRKIQGRTLKMLECGFLEEIENLLKKYGKQAPALQSIGYKQGVAFLQGDLTKQEMIEKIQQKTRQYAKRQRTWQRSICEACWFEEDEIFKKV